MKRLLLLVSVMLLGIAGAQAQKVDEAGIRKRIDKLKTDSQNEKKAAKAQLWIDLGKAYTDAATAPVAGIFGGLDEASAKLILGNPSASTVEVIGGNEFKKNSYPWMDVFFYDGRVYFWLGTKTVEDKALEKAVEAYMTAYKKDAGAAAKVAAGLLGVVNAYKEEGGNFFSAQRYVQAGDDFARAYDLQAQAPISVIDTASAYNAGMSYVTGGEYAKGEKYIQEAISHGYESDGEAYYYLFHSFYGRKDLAKAKEALLAGIAKYPNNTNIIESLLNLYGESGDNPDEIIPYVEAALKEDPNNPELYSGMGLVFNRLGDMDKAVESFRKAVELAPDSYNYNFNLAYMLIRKGDSMAEEARNATVTSQEDYNKILESQNQAYRDALVPLEKAHQINPKEVSVVDYLKSVYFRLRDEPGMMEKYNEYNELFKSMQ